MQAERSSRLALPPRDVASDTIDVSVVLPTLCEAENLPPLLGRIDRALAGRRYEGIVVDEASGDGTAEVCAQLAGRFPLVLHIRQSPTDGLSGAVLAGFRMARGRVLVAMDADLQHPPEELPNLITPILSGDADFVIGSRYVRGGRIGQRWSLFRRLNSWLATLMARPLVGRVADPMSGFFAIRREVFAKATALNPIGYKIALELMCKCPIRELREIPIEFGQRAHGCSKLTLKQQKAYLQHVWRLYAYRFPAAGWAVDRLARFVQRLAHRSRPGGPRVRAADAVPLDDSSCRQVCS